MALTTTSRQTTRSRKSEPSTTSNSLIRQLTQVTPTIKEVATPMAITCNSKPGGGSQTMTNLCKGPCNNNNKSKEGLATKEVLEVILLNRLLTRT